MARFRYRWLILVATATLALVTVPTLGYSADPDTEKPSTPGALVAAFPASGTVTATTAPPGTGEGGVDTTPPTMPTSVTATNVTTSSLTLTWPASSDNVGVSGYDVWQTYTDVVWIRSTTTNSLTITGLSASGTYRFSVRARDAAGNLSALTTSLKVIMAPGDAQPPSTPTGLAASNVTGTEATLSWARSTDNVIVEAYEVFRIQPSGNTLVATTPSYPGPPTSIRLTGLTTATAYRFAVRARDAVGNVSGLSTEITLTPGATTAPPACAATYRIVSQWPGAFQGEITVSAAAPITGWTVRWSFPSGQVISNLWGGISTQAGGSVTVRNESWNNTVPPSRTFGFQASWSATNDLPTAVTCTSP